MEEKIITTEIAKLDLCPGDILVIRSEMPIDDKTTIYKFLKKRLQGINVIVLGKDDSLSILRPNGFDDGK